MVRCRERTWRVPKARLPKRESAGILGELVLQIKPVHILELEPKRDAEGHLPIPCWED